MIATEHVLQSAEAIAKVLSAIGLALTPVGVVLGAWWAKDGRKHAREVNDAVNNVHKHGGERMYDMVMQTQKEVEKGFIRNQQQHEQLQEQIHGMTGELTQNRRHIVKLWYQLFPDSDYDDVGPDGEEMAG